MPMPIEPLKTAHLKRQMPHLDSRAPQQLHLAQQGRLKGVSDMLEERSTRDNIIHVTIGTGQTPLCQTPPCPQ
eukprot:5621274-Amphidinium_carterae.1